MLAVARRLRPDLTWRTADRESLPFPDAAFDWALSQAALMFFDDRVAALREMARVAGRVVLQVPGRLSHSPGYPALADVVAHHAGPAARDLLSSYFAVGRPGVPALRRRARRRPGGRPLRDVDERDPAAGRVDTFLDAELLPLADAVGQARDRGRRPGGARAFIDAAGAIAAPIEVTCSPPDPPAPSSGASGFAAYAGGRRAPASRSLAGAAVRTTTDPSPDEFDLASGHN